MGIPTATESRQERDFVCLDPTGNLSLLTFLTFLTLLTSLTFLTN